MAGPPDNRGLGRGFDRPPDERSKRIDVIGNAGVIIPKLRSLISLDVERKKQTFLDASVGHKAEAFGESEFVRAIRSQLAVPIWGALEQIDPAGINKAGGRGRVSLVGKEVLGDHVLAEAKDALISNSVMIAEESLLRESSSPRVSDSLVIGGTVLYGSNTNNTGFNPDQLLLITQVAEALRENDKDSIEDCLRELDGHVENYDRNTFGRYAEDRDMYREKFGELAEVAAIVDSRYLKALQGDETTDVEVDNSIVFGTSSRELGGRVSNSIIVDRQYPFGMAHVDVNNCYFVSGNRNIEIVYIKEGRLGDPKKAKAAVEAAADLPPSPLLSM